MNGSSLHCTLSVSIVGDHGFFLQPHPGFVAYFLLLDRSGSFLVCARRRGSSDFNGS
jgi:hypothetical protein